MKSYIVQLMALVGIMMAFALVSSFLAGAIWMAGGINVLQLDSIELEPSQRSIFRWGLVLNHFMMFTLAGLVFVWMYYKQEWAKFLQIVEEPKVEQIVKWGVIILVSYPFLSGLVLLNEAIPFPEWMRSGQDSTLKIMTQALTMDGIQGLFESLLLVGLLAGLGEEIIFRGIVQKTFERMFNNYHMAIWLAAIIFGAFHMQVERFLPLSFLGALLGYSYYYTKSLIVPIMLHFLNNSLQVIVLYTLDLDVAEQLANDEALPTIVIICSGLITFALWFNFGPRRASLNESRP